MYFIEILEFSEMKSNKTEILFWQQQYMLKFAITFRFKTYQKHFVGFNWIQVETPDSV